MSICVSMETMYNEANMSTKPNNYCNLITLLLIVGEFGSVRIMNKGNPHKL